MASNSVTYQNISPAQFDTLMSEAKANGISTDGQTLSAHGVTLVYNYDASKNMLVLTIQHKGFPASFVSDGDIFKQIEKAAGLNA